MFHLIVTQSDVEVLAVNLSAGEHLVGRAPDCAIVFAHRSVSRQHAMLAVTSGVVHLRDLGSRNGTFVDARRVESSDVADGQSMRFGDIKCVLRIGSHFAGIGETERSSPGEAESRELTPGQRRVLAELLKGHKERQIAKHLHLSIHTVHTHVRAIYEQLGVHSRAELLAQLLNQRT